MANEQERKYLVEIPKLRDLINKGTSDGETITSKSLIKQAYLGDGELWGAYITQGNKKKLSLVSIQLEQNHSFEMDNDDVEQLVNHPSTLTASHGLSMISLKHWALRIRVFENGDGEVTFKERTHGEIRGECNAKATPEIANLLLNSVDTRIEKTRYLIQKAGYTWDVDLFHDKNEGLAIAELETSDKNYPPLSIIKFEVTDDARYYNDNLSSTPFTLW